MSDISMGQSARPFRFYARNGRPKAKLHHFPARKKDGRPATAGTHASEQLSFMSVKREYASCFVDFLLGRGSRPPR